VIGPRTSGSGVVVEVGMTVEAFYTAGGITVGSIIDVGVVLGEVVTVALW